MSATATRGHDGGIEARRRGRRIPARLLRLASDERLVDLLRGGSEAAFEVIYTRHHRGVLSFCRHMLGSVEEAEDALQHTFLAAYRNLLASGKPIQLRPWLYTIARNRCLSVLRVRRERTPDELVEPSTEQLSHEVEQRHDLRAMLGDLAALPSDQRAALVLAELGDMSHDEIGHVLGCEREKVKGLVFQARSSLIASRTARETSCAEIRQQLANLRGGSLRRNTLRRHLRECEGCREYNEQVRAQRSALALILPVAPSLGLKATVLGAAGVGAAAGGSASVVATTAIVLAVAGGGAAAVEVARDDRAEREPRPAKVVPAAAAPEAPAAAPRSASPTSRRGAGRTDRGRWEGERAERRERAAAVGTDELKPGTRGKGAKPPKAARPVRAQGPPAARPLKTNGPKADKVRDAKPKVDKTRAADNVRGPKPKVEKARSPAKPLKPVPAVEPEPAEALEPEPAEALEPPIKSRAG
jgi:RNA polymerase sigma factor (sigma-70 family)